jgi:hypothetical protein
MPRGNARRAAEVPGLRITGTQTLSGDVLADDVVLEASVLRRPIEGRDHVTLVMETATEAYESLVFTHKASDGRHSFLEWEGTAFGGMALDGVTTLIRDDDGRIVRAAIHYRPLGAALRFSEELRDRLDGLLDSTYFYNPYYRVPNGWD